MAGHDGEFIDILIGLYRRIACVTVLFALLAAPRDANAAQEIDGTVVGMGQGDLIIRDISCKIQRFTATDSAWNGHPLVLFDPSYNGKNVHIVWADGPIEPRLISATTQNAPGAPRNCTTYTRTRTVEGILKTYDMGSSAGSLSIVLDTRDSATFSFSNSDTRARLFGNHRITAGLPPNVKLGVTRVRVTYHVADDVNGKRAEIVSVDRAAP